MSALLVAQKFWLGPAGGLFLCVLGVRTFNPMTILSFVAVFAGLGLVASPDYGSASAMVLGVFAGSAFWWLLLSNGVALFRDRIGPGPMRLVNHISGAIIVAFGIYAIASALRR